MRSTTSKLLPPPRPCFTRKNIRLFASRYLGRNEYFFTLCFENRRRYGANRRVAEWLISSLRKHALAWRFHIHAYCIMPDHVHILASGAADGSNAMAFIESFKQATARTFTQRTNRRLWQFKYYDHILRNRDSADRVCWYIWMNPVRKGVCAVPSEYPYLGSFTEIGNQLLRSFTPLIWTPPWKQKGVNVAPGSLARHFRAQT